MITRKPLTQHICLRCQRSLAKRSLHPQLPPLSQTTPERRRYSQQAAPKTNDDIRSDDNIKDIGRGESGVYDTRKSQGKLRGYRGIIQREDLEELRGATALGDQAKVIVLRDSIFSKYVLEEQKMRVLKAQHIDILGTLAEEQGLIGEDEVAENINAFRPTDGEGIHDFEELNELVSNLEQGFTSSQLENYMKNFKNKRERDKPVEPWKAKNSQAPVTEITPWLPGISEITEYFDNDPLREYYRSSHTPKQVLALRVLRECWMLELPDLVDGIGQFEVRLRDGDLDLLLLGPDAILDSIHATHLLFEEERLEAFRSRNTIRVTTTNAKKYAIVDAIQQSVKSIRRGDINLAALLSKELDGRQVERWIAKHLDDKALAALGEVTNTKIIRKAPRFLQVSCIEHDQDAASSKIDIVRRLILTCDNFSNRLEHELAVKQKKATRGALVEYTLTGGLNWRQKMRSWTRFAAPIPKESPSSGAAKASTKNALIEPELSALPSTQASTTAAPTPADEVEEKGSWSRRYFTDTSALMGAVLHSNPDNVLIGPESTPMNTHGLLHAFSTKVPNLSQVLSKGDVLHKGRKTNRLILRFQPDPFVLTPKQIKRPKYPSSFKEVPIGTNALSAFPSIEMTFDIDEDKNTTLKAVYAVVHEKKTDVMVPDNAVDIRFQQRTTSRLQKRHLAPIKKFLGKSQLSLAVKGRKLDTPPSIILPISSHLCRDEGFKLFGKEPSEKVPEEREIQYLFAGLELHSTIAFTWKSFQVYYTSIEAGKAGGRRAELKIRPITNGKVASEKQFIAGAYRLADMLGDGTGEHIDMDDVKTVETTERKGGLMRPVPAKKEVAKPNLLFGYFSGKFKINKGGEADTTEWGKSEEVVDEEPAEMKEIDGVEKMDSDDLEAAAEVEDEMQGEMLQKQHKEWMEKDNDRPA